MNEEYGRTKGKLLSRLLLIRADLQGVNKKYLDKEFKNLFEDIEDKVEIFIKKLIENEMPKM